MADDEVRDLSGGVDTSGFVGVDPMYQNYSTDAGKPFNTKEEQKAIDASDWGTTGATAVTEGKAPEEEPTLKAKTNDEGQVITEGGDGGFAAGATTVTPAEAPKEEKAAAKAPAKD